MAWVIAALSALACTALLLSFVAMLVLRDSLLMSDQPLSEWRRVVVDSYARNGYTADWFLRNGVTVLVGTGIELALWLIGCVAVWVIRLPLARLAFAGAAVVSVYLDEWPVLAVALLSLTYWPRLHFGDQWSQIHRPNLVSFLFCVAALLGTLVGIGFAQDVRVLPLELRTQPPGVLVGMGIGTILRTVLLTGLAALAFDKGRSLLVRPGAEHKPTVSAAVD